MNNLAKLAFAIILLASCAREEDLIGMYETDRYNDVVMASKNIFQKTSFSVGNTIELNEDSSFVYKTCGNVMEGYWSIKADSLVLDIHSNKWRVDSLQEHGFNGRWPKSCFSSSFSIDGDHLIHVHKRNPDIEGDYRVFTRLKKIQD